MSEIKMIGNQGCYVDKNNVITFRIDAGLVPVDVGYSEKNINFFTPRFTNVDRYKIYSRGVKNFLKSDYSPPKEVAFRPIYGCANENSLNIKGKA